MTTTTEPIPRDQWYQLVQGELLAVCREAVRTGDAVEVKQWQQRLKQHQALSLLDRRVRSHHHRMAQAILSLAEQLMTDGGATHETAEAQEQLRALAETTGLDAAPYGLPFFRALCYVLQGGTMAEVGTSAEQPKSSAYLAPFLLVLYDVKGTVRGARLARFVLTQPSCAGTGSAADETILYIDSEQAFLFMDEAFLSIFDAAVQGARTVVNKNAGEVCVRLEWVDKENMEATGFSRIPAHRMLEGGSGGGALALGLCSLLTGIPLEPHVVASFALSKDSVCEEVRGLNIKITEPLEKDTTLVVAQMQADDLAAVSGKSVEGAHTLQEAFDYANGRLRALDAYLDWLERRANEVPSYLKRWSDRSLDSVFVRVRVYPDFRKQFDALDARQREKILMGDPESMYKHWTWRFSSQEEDEGRGQQRPRELDWEEARRDLRRGVIIGDPGIGKTWLLRREAVRLAQALRDQMKQVYRDVRGVLQQSQSLELILARAPLPVWLRLDEIAKQLEGPRSFGQAVIEALRAKYAGDTDEQAASRLALVVTEKNMREGRIFLLLDALDEVSSRTEGVEDAPSGDAGRNEQATAPDEAEYDRKAKTPGDVLVNQMRAWTHDHKGARVLITSRAASYHFGVPPLTLTDPSKQQMELLPFNDHQIETFVKNWFTGAQEPQANDMMEMLRQAPHLHGISMIPLLLGFLCLLYDDPGEGRSDLRSMTRGDIYREVLGRLMLREHRDEQGLIKETDIAKRLETLEEVAFDLFAAGKDQFSQKDLEWSIAHAKDPGARQYDVLPENIRAACVGLIEDLSEKDGLLVRTGGEKNRTYLFLHLTFQEYLTARALARRINESPRRWASHVEAEGKTVTVRHFVDRKAWDPRYEQVIMLLAGGLEREDDQCELLELLIREDDLFLHRHALAAHCLPEIKALLPPPPSA